MKTFLGAAFVPALLGLAVLLGPEETTLVRIRLTDGAGGATVPGMVCLSGSSGEVRLPPDGRILDQVSKTDAFYAGISFDPDPAWIGPVRKMRGKGDNKDRSYVYELDPSVPYWAEPVMMQVSGNFSIRLPAGRWRLAVDRGMEHIPAVEEFEVDGRGSVERTVAIDRWIDLSQEGWWSGDAHVHHPTQQEAQREYLLEYARAVDLNVVNVLEMGDSKTTHFRQAGFGKDFRVRRGNVCLVSGQEDPRSTFGHVIGLNLTGMVRDFETYDFYDLAFRGIHAQEGAVVGYAHFSWNGCQLPRGFPWYVTTEEVDFVELLHIGRINPKDYYEYLNLGFRLAAGAGSDIPWGSTLGKVRIYAHTGPEFDVDAWFRAVKEGRTFVSNGPALELTVDGDLPGAELRRKSGEQISVKARVRCHPRIGVLTSLRVVSNEGTLQEVAGDGEKTELSLNLKVPLARSRWIAAMADCGNGAVAHSSPVYVVVDGRPTWDPERGPALVDQQLAAIAPIEQEFSGKDDKRAAGVLERIAKAKAYYADLKARMEAAAKK